MIPEWNMAGLLPPIYPGESGASPVRSPYKTDLHQIANRLAQTPERKAILQGFLLFRDDLRKLGIERGFQWLDGSYLEKVEDIESRPPRDIDVVTFFYLPEKESQDSLIVKYPNLFDPENSKKTYSVDAYFHILGKPIEEYDVRQIAYWYSMWSHRRDKAWKGFIQVELSSSDDKISIEKLDIIQQSGV